MPSSMKWYTQSESRSYLPQVGSGDLTIDTLVYAFLRTMSVTYEMSTKNCR